MREAVGIKPGVDVTLEIRDDEIVISRPKIRGSYTEYYISTRSSKLKKRINVKAVIAEEVSSRHALS